MKGTMMNTREIATLAARALHTFNHARDNGYMADDGSISAGNVAQSVDDMRRILEITGYTYDQCDLGEYVAGTSPNAYEPQIGDVISTFDGRYHGRCEVDAIRGDYVYYRIHRLGQSNDMAMCTRLVQFRAMVAALPERHIARRITVGGAK